MSKILQSQGTVWVWPRLGKRLFISGLPDDLLIGGDSAAYATSIQVMDFDVTGKVICLNDKRVLYEFGKGFGTIKVDGELFIGPAKSGTTGRGAITANDASLGRIIDWFNENRVSARTEPLTIQTSGEHGEFVFFASSFSVNGIQPEIGLVSFSITGDLVTMSG
jgi:hypothetical protein